MKTLKVLFICRIDEREDFDTAEKMATSIMKANSDSLECDYARIEELVFSYDGSKLLVVNGVTKKDIADYDFVFFLGWFKDRQLEEVAHAASLYLDNKDVPFINSELLKNRSRSKVSQYVHAALAGLKCTMPFVYSMNGELLFDYMAQDLSKIGMPFIAKGPFASRGRDNFLVRSMEEFSEIIKATETSLVVQPWVPNDGDYRLIVLGDKVRIAIKRRSLNGGHTNNTSQGGTAAIEEISSLNPEMISDALTIAKLIRREVTGVDMIIHSDTGEYHFLEANNMPQLSTGVFTTEKAEAIGEYIREIVREKAEV